MRTRAAAWSFALAAGALAMSFAMPVKAETGSISFNFNLGYLGFMSDGQPAGEFSVVPATFTGIVHPAMAPVAAITGSEFQTFCLERYERLDFGPVYSFVSGNAAMGGGLGAVGGMDPLSPETAFLYTAFFNGTLTGYDYTFGPARQGSAVQLQEAIWVLESEIAESSLNTVTDAKAIAFLARARAATLPGGEWDVIWGQNSIGAVRVLVLTDAAGSAAQDVLVLTNFTPPPKNPCEPPKCDKDRNCKDWQTFCKSWERDCRTYHRNCNDWNSRCIAWNKFCKDRDDQDCRDWSKFCSDWEKSCKQQHRDCNDYSRRCSDWKKYCDNRDDDDNNCRDDNHGYNNCRW